MLSLAHTNVLAACVTVFRLLGQRRTTAHVLTDVLMASTVTRRVFRIHIELVHGSVLYLLLAMLADLM